MKSKNKTSKRTEIISCYLFVFLLLWFLQYAPFWKMHTQTDSFSQILFNLYFFITNNTLGMIHEAGHGVCYILPCPRFLMVLNGTIFQLGFPLGIAYYYRRKNNHIATRIALFFSGFSLHYTAWYISTSHEGSFVPASKSFLGADGYHDFNYILNVFGLLSYDSLIASLVKVVAYVLMFYAVGKMCICAFSSSRTLV